MIKQNKQIEYWRKSAEIDWKTAKGLFKIKRYDGCLFYCHLALEKLLKGLAVKKIKKSAPQTHDLERLSILANLPISKEQTKNLQIITKFNIASRYDSFKFSFYKKCTKNYTKKYLNISEDLILWLKKQYQKK